MSAAPRMPRPPSAPSRHRAQMQVLLQHRLDVLPLPLQGSALAPQHGQELRQLGPLVPANVIHINEFPDFGEGQAKPAATQGQLQAGTIALGVDAALAGPLRADQALIADGTGGDVEFPRELGDREGLFPGHVQV